MTADITTITHAYGLGKLLEPPIPVIGGRSHRIWKLHTGKGCFAVKQLLLEGAHPNKLAEVRETERLAYSLSQQQFPALAAMLYQQEPILAVGDKHYVLYPWLEGVTIAPAKVGPQHAYLIGEALGKLHQFPARDTALARFTYRVFTEQEWRYLADRAAEYRLPYATQLATHLATLINLDLQGSIGFEQLGADVIISHGDIDPYNVLWCDKGSFRIIDWELANLAHPAVDFIATLLYWSLNGASTIRAEHMQRFSAGYSACCSFKGMIAVAFYIVLGHWLKWFEFNLLRATNTADLSIKTISVNEAQKTLDTVIYLAPLIADVARVIEGY